MKILGIEHIGIAVKDLNESSSFWGNILNILHSHSESVKSESVNTKIYDTSRGKIELLTSMESNSPIDKFIRNRGPGIHHVCLEVDDVYLAIIEPKSSGIEVLNDISVKWQNISMLARTHGQPASPTKLGKEIKVFITRIEEQKNLLSEIPIAAKFGGATGNFNAHHVAYGKFDWIEFSKQFIEKKLGLKHSFPTTQIEHYDHLAAIFDNLKRINTILIDFNRDIWTYISMDYFKQQIKEGEIGSSAMPHKVNPIDFENSEGNLGYANSIFEHLSNKLPISRLQRDLTDSTVLRNIGVPLAHTIIGFKSTLKGIGKLIVNEVKIKRDLEDNWVVIAEAIQTILRRENYPKPYEALKELTRTNKKIDKKHIHNFIDSLSVSESIKIELKDITPENFTGIH